MAFNLALQFFKANDGSAQSLYYEMCEEGAKIKGFKSFGHDAYSHKSTYQEAGVIFYPRPGAPHHVMVYHIKAEVDRNNKRWVQSMPVTQSLHTL